MVCEIIVLNNCSAYRHRKDNLVSSVTIEHLSGNCNISNECSSY